MKALITGVTGLIGSHLADFLAAQRMEVYGVYLKSKIWPLPDFRKNIHLVHGNLLRPGGLEPLLKRVRPDYVFHLAAQSYVIPSWKNPEQTFRTNVFGTWRLLEAIRKNRLDPVIVVACTSAEYGLTRPDEVPIPEGREFRPSSPYAVSKMAVDGVSYLYWQAYKMRILRIRFFSITGPRKWGDVCSDFARGIALVEKGKAKELRVGKLDTIRDITDVRDAVQGIWCVARKGTHGGVYNLCSGRDYEVKNLLQTALSLSRKKIPVVTSSQRFRTLDDPIFIGDNSKIRRLGWAPKIPIEKTLEDSLNYWRKRV